MGLIRHNKTINLTSDELKNGYNWAYKEFYSWPNILKASLNQDSHKHKLKHFFYSGGWKKFEPVWNFMIKTKNLNGMLPLLESILSKVNTQDKVATSSQDMISNKQLELITQSNDNIW